MFPPTLARAGSARLWCMLALGAAVTMFHITGYAQDELEEIVVTADGSQVRLPGAYAGGQVARGGRAGLFGNLDFMDMPFSITSYTSDLIRNQQATSVGDVLRNDPVVRVAKGFGNFQQLYVIRGFPVYSDDMTYNGLYGILPRQFVAAELLERVEVFHGANSFLNGAAPGGSGVGGAVNLVPKRAPDEPLSRLTLGYENEGQSYAALDVARRFGRDGATGVRFNAVTRDGETSVAEQDRELSVLSIGVDYQGDALRLSADFGQQNHHIDSPRPSVTPLGEIPQPPDAASNFAQPWTYTDERQFFGVVRGEIEITDRVTVWAAAGLRDGEEENVLSNPNAYANGDTSAYRFDNTREDDIFSADVGVRAELDTGTVSHRLIASAASISIESRNAYAFSSFTGFAGNLYVPIDVAPPPADFFVGGSLAAPLLTQKTDNSSIAVADLIAFAEDRFLLTLGARLQSIETRTFDYNTGAGLSSYDEERVTPVAGLVYKPNERISAYANYSEGLIPGQIAPRTSGGSPVENAGEVFEPYQAKQFEIGVKYDGGDFGGSVSAFTTTLPSGFVEDGVFSVAGEQRNSGIELSVFGKPAETLRLIGGLTLLDAEMTNTQDGMFDGRDAIGTPDTQLNVNVEWDVPAVPGLTLDGRVIYTAPQYANLANTVSASSWSRVDLGARYSVRIASADVVFRARVESAADRDYWSSVGGYPGANYLVLAPPRTFVLSAAMDF